MKYCVYLHKTKDGLVFYVGQGRLRRAYATEKSEQKGRATCRGKSYSEFVKSLNYEYDIEIVAENLTKKDALDLELVYYNKHKDTVLNRNKPSKTLLIPKTFIEDNLYYDTSSPSCLRWKTSRLNGRGKVFIEKDSSAGCLQDNYYVINLKGKIYKAHRLIAILHGLEIDDLIVDHIDGNPSNNRIENLRVTTQAINSRNLRKRASSIRGVSRSKSGNGFYAWAARWVQDGMNRSRHFSIIKYGEDKAYQLALDYRNKMIAQLNNEGMGYTEMHTM